MSAPSKSRRQSELAKIHIGAKQLLGDDREAYRDMVEEVTGKRSAGELDAAGRRRLLEHLKGCGAKFGPPARERPRPRPSPDTELLLRKIDALCINDPTGRKPRSYAEGILRRMVSGTHRTPLEWAEPQQLLGVIAALENKRRRDGARSAEGA